MENKKQIPYLDKSYSDKRRILREYSIKDEIRDAVATIADETIVYFNSGSFCSAKVTDKTNNPKYKKRIEEIYEEIYNKMGFNDGISAWNMLKDFLIDGFIAMEIIWDDKKKSITGFNRLRPDTLVPMYQPGIGNMWIQYPEDPQLKRIFLDSQIMFISYTAQNNFSETSYVEGLIKPYNQLRILEQAALMVNIKNATMRQVFTIPIKGLSKQRAEEQIGQLISNYSENIEWDETLGTLRIDGAKQIPFSKQTWLPDGDMGTPKMEIVDNQVNFDPNQLGTIGYFLNKLKSATRIPYTGGLDDKEVKRFANFISRVRINFKEILVKPVTLQTHVEFPELIGNNDIKIDIIYNN